MYVLATDIAYLLLNNWEQKARLRIYLVADFDMQINQRPQSKADLAKNKKTTSNVEGMYISGSLKHRILSGSAAIGHHTLGGGAHTNLSLQYMVWLISDQFPGYILGVAD